MAGAAGPVNPRRRPSVRRSPALFLRRASLFPPFPPPAPDTCLPESPLVPLCGPCCLYNDLSTLQDISQSARSPALFVASSITTMVRRLPCAAVLLLLLALAAVSHGACPKELEEGRVQDLAPGFNNSQCVYAGTLPIEASRGPGAALFYTFWAAQSGEGLGRARNNEGRMKEERGRRAEGVENRKYEETRRCTTKEVL